jgi:hypothetical protein
MKKGVWGLTLDYFVITKRLELILKSCTAKNRIIFESKSTSLHPCSKYLSLTSLV